MKNNFVYLLVILVLLPFGFTGSGSHNSNCSLSAGIKHESHPKNSNISSLASIFTQLSAFVPTGDYTLKILRIGSVSVDLFGLLELDLQTKLVYMRDYGNAIKNTFLSLLCELEGIGYTAQLRLPQRRLNIGGKFVSSSHKDNIAKVFKKEESIILAMIMMFLLVGCTTRETIINTPLPTTFSQQTAQPTPSEKPATAPSPSQVPFSTLSSTAPLLILPLTNEQIELYGLLELDLQTTLQVSNPYDPHEIDLRVSFSAPSGKEVEVGAFWYQDYDLTTRLPKGEPGWKARFTPTEIGKWSVVAHIQARGLKSAAISFQVIESDKPGFVRINPSNPRYFAFDDGSFFFPIGLNIAWWSGARDALTDYKKWMEPFAMNGGNTIRVWMADWSFGIEWSDTPLGNYNNRLYRAWLLDQIFNMARNRGIYIMLVLLNCADFNNWQTNGWNSNPYNAANGGPLDSPAQFATDPTACTLLQRKLNYIINRWGYSTHLLAWEWWNEVNLAEIPDDLLFPWYQEMTAYLKAIDVNNHLVTNSYAISDTSPSWLLPEMEIIQKHEYANQEATSNKDLAERVVADLKILVGNAPPKPALLGEFGYGDEGYGNESDKTGIHLHNGLWATTYAGYAGSGMFWWWDVYVERYNLWHHFKGLSTFLEGVDLTGYTPFSPLKISTSEDSESQAYGLGLRGEDTLVWIRSNAYTAQAVEAAVSGKSSAYVYLPPLVEGLYLSLNVMEDGEYTVNWYDPQGAEWTEVTIITAQNHTLTIPIPSFRKDLAAKIFRNP